MFMYIFFLYAVNRKFVVETKHPLIPDKVNTYLSNNVCLLINNNLCEFNYKYW